MQEVDLFKTTDKEGLPPPEYVLPPSGKRPFNPDGVTREKFEAWAQRTPVLFMSTEHYLPQYEGQTLRFYGFIDGSYLVTIGTREMYRGKDFELAASTYNMNRKM